MLDAGAVATIALVHDDADRPQAQAGLLGVSATLTTTAFDRSSLRWLEISTCLPNPKGPPSSLVQLRTADTHDGARDTRPQAVIRKHSCDLPMGITDRAMEAWYPPSIA